MSDNDLTRRNALWPTMPGNALMPSDRELFEEAMQSPMVDIRPEMRSLAGKMMHHYDVEVRDIAATLLRCVERLETGR